VRISILPKTSLGKWSIGLVAAIIITFILVPILVHQIGIDFEPKSLKLIMVAAVLTILSIGSIVTGSIGVRGKRGFIYFLPLVLGFFALLISIGMMLDTGA